MLLNRLNKSTTTRAPLLIALWLLFAQFSLSTHAHELNSEFSNEICAVCLHLSALEDVTFNSSTELFNADNSTFISLPSSTGHFAQTDNRLFNIRAPPHFISEL